MIHWHNFRRIGDFRVCRTCGDVQELRHGGWHGVHPNVLLALSSSKDTE